MIICLQNRKGKIHYISWNSPARGYYFTMCGISFFKKNHLSIFGIDESIPGACINCRKTEECERDTRTYRSALGDGILFKYLDIQSGFKSPQEEFYDLFNRHWNKLRKMKSKMRQPPTKKHKRSYHGSGQSKYK